MKKNIRDYKVEELKMLINESTSMADFFRKIGYAKSGNGYKQVKKYLDSVGIDHTVLTRKNKSTKQKTNEEVFIVNSSYDRKCLKARIIKQKLIKYVCSKCNNNGE